MMEEAMCSLSKPASRRRVDCALYRGSPSGLWAESVDIAHIPSPDSEGSLQQEIMHTSKLIRQINQRKPGKSQRQRTPKPCEIFSMWRILKIDSMAIRMSLNNLQRP